MGALHVNLIFSLVVTLVSPDQYLRATEEKGFEEVAWVRLGVNLGSPILSILQRVQGGACRVNSFLRWLSVGDCTQCLMLGCFTRVVPHAN